MNRFQPAICVVLVFLIAIGNLYAQWGPPPETINPVIQIDIRQLDIQTGGIPQAVSNYVGMYLNDLYPQFYQHPIEVLATVKLGVHNGIEWIEYAQIDYYSIFKSSYETFTAAAYNYPIPMSLEQQAKTYLFWQFMELQPGFMQSPPPPDYFEEVESVPGVMFLNNAPINVTIIYRVTCTISAGNTTCVAKIVNVIFN